jgi:23S rRNA (cytosine1962-C5)-methyltransferase
VRMLSSRIEPIGEPFLLQRLQTAQQWRDRVFAQPYYRLVYGDSDGLSGLIVDRYNQVLVVQCTTAGMEALKPLVVSALIKLLQPQAIVERSDGSLRELEGLPAYKGVLFGGYEENSLTQLQENGVSFAVPLMQGQKTGWFYDHRMGRDRLCSSYVKGKKVLDVFSYIGAWGIQAACAGATHVTCVDSSEFALKSVAHNAALNSVADKVSTLCGDAFDTLQNLINQGESYDVVIVDPPAFIKRKKDHKNGLLAYKRINMLALRLLRDDGILVSSSCSYHLERDELLQGVSMAASELRKTIRLVEECHQGLDHPIHPFIAETAYIKTLIFHSKKPT